MVLRWGWFVGGVALACSLLDCSGDDEGSGIAGRSGNGGSGNAGGASDASGNAGGSAGTTGSAGSAGSVGSGGAPATGGAGGMPTGGRDSAPDSTTGGRDGSVVCDPIAGTPGSCAPSDPSDGCQQCVQENCCDEWRRCVATNPLNPCGFGGPQNEGEIVCFQRCVFAIVAGGGDVTQTVIRNCAGSCATQGCGTIADSTNDVIVCLDSSCFTECLQP